MELSGPGGRGALIWEGTGRFEFDFDKTGELDYVPTGDPGPIIISQAEQVNGSTLTMGWAPRPTAAIASTSSRR